MKIWFSPLLCCWAVLALFSGCEKNPMNRIINPAASNTAGTWSGRWALYADELKTGGSVMLFNEGMTVDFNSAENPRSGDKCLKYSWDGNDILTYKSLPAHPTDYLQHDFTGFSLICARSSGEYFTGTRDLSLAGYTKITFWARGALGTNVYLRVEANSDSPVAYQLASGATGVWMGRPTASWAQYTVTLDNTVNNLAAARDFVKFILRYDEDGDPDTANAGKGNGGIVYIDDVELSR